MKNIRNFLKRKYPNNIYSIKIAILLLLPAFVLRGFTSFYPIFNTIYLSFFNYTAMVKMRFNGFGNFITLAKDPSTQSSLFFTLVFTLASTFLQISLGLLIALFLNRKFIGNRFISTINIIPWAIPLVVVGMAARFAFNTEYGVINDLIYKIVGISGIKWFQSIWLARIAVILVDVWKSVGFMVIIFLASLKGIPRELIEAAEVDGANSYQSIFKIILPLLKPIIIIMVLFSLIWRMTTFDLIYAMTWGGPGVGTSVVSFKIFQTFFKFLDFGSGSAIASVILIVAMIIGIFLFRFLNISESEI